MLSFATRRRIWSVLSWLPLVVGVLLAAYFVRPTLLRHADTPPAEVLAAVHAVPPATTRNIEDLRVGDRVLAHNPEISDSERATWLEPDWERDCLRLKLEMGKPDGGVLKVDLIRPLEWVLAAGAIRGGFIQLDLPEMGASGLAWVASIEECPPVKPGAGQVITATFSHPPSTAVLDVTVEGDSEPLGVTDNHLFWSVDRQEFVPIGQMAIGERLLTLHGDTKRIVSKLPRPGPQVVYNLEVYGEHVYWVGEAGSLAHNNYQTLTKRQQAKSDQLEKAGYFPQTSVRLATTTSLQHLDIAPYQYRRRLSPNIDRHELINNAALVAAGLSPERGIGFASRHNPTILVSKAMHQMINREQMKYQIYSGSKISGTEAERIQLDDLATVNAFILAEPGINVPAHKIDEMVQAARVHLLRMSGLKDPVISP